MRTANIEAAATRLAAKQAGRENTRTLVATKGALNRVDLGKAYYEAVVRPSREPVPEVEDGAAGENDMNDEEEKTDDPAKGESALASLPKRGRIRANLGRKLRQSSVFSSRRIASTRPPKPMAKF